MIYSVIGFYHGKLGFAHAARVRQHGGNVRVSFEDNGGVALVRQENSYYPFGLSMPGSTIPSAANKNLYNGGSEWQDDFADLPDLQQTFYRNYDPALGRFVAVDPMAEASESWGTYHYALNNPLMFNDPLGDQAQYPTMASYGWNSYRTGSGSGNHWSDNLAINQVQSGPYQGFWDSVFDFAAQGGTGSIRYSVNKAGQKGFWGETVGRNYETEEKGYLNTIELSVKFYISGGVKQELNDALNQSIDRLGLLADIFDPLGAGAGNILEHRGRYLPRGEIYRINRQVVVRTPIANFNTNSKFLKGLKVGSKALVAANILASAYVIGKDVNEGKYKSATARAAVVAVATGAAFIPVVGWGVTLGIGIADYIWGDQFYNWVEKQ